MKIRIVNQNYVYPQGVRDRLQPARYAEDKPWMAYVPGRYTPFPTHAEAIRYADELARGLREVS